MFNVISMIGLGYIGLPTAALFASRNKTVIGVDVSPKVVETVNKGEIHIIEPELDGVVHKAVRNGFLRATLKPEPADAFLIAVPTPFMDDHKPDLSYIKSAASMIAPVLSKGCLVVLESTSPVGSTELLAQWLADERPDLSFPQDKGDDADVQVAYCPERVLPGKVVHELVSNDRVIGGMSRKASSMALELYKIFVEGNCIVSDSRTAEMCKLTENSFRDVNIAFANELSVICDKLGINVWELIALANRHPRVNILQPGCGVGGHCIAVDPWFIVDKTPDEAKIIRAAREINDNKPHWVLDRIEKCLKDILFANPEKPMKELTVACLGLAFKPDIDDLRESPALEITAHAAKFGCRVLAVEPNIDVLPEKLKNCGVEFTSLDDALAQADVVCVLVKHSMFKEKAKEILSGQFTVDTVGL